MENLENGGENIEAKPKSKGRYVPEIIVGAGYLLFFVLLTVACVATLFMIYSSRVTQQTAPALNLPPLTPTPHILATPAMGAPGVFADDFSGNSNQWGREISAFTQTEVLNGTLDLASTHENSFSYILCATCPYMDGPHYVQAELRTDRSTDFDFGVLTRSSYSSQDFYLFGIGAQSRQYFLIHHFYDHWWLRASGVAGSIRSFPAANTLGINVDGSTLQLYINGNVVDEYHEQGISFETGKVGFYVGGADFKLWVDNLLIQKEGSK